MNIRNIKESDKNEIITMMREFYSSPAVLSDGSDEIFQKDIDACLSDSPYIEGFVFECDNYLAGYAMIAKSFSTEFGKNCIWVEDLFIKKEFRAHGIGSRFLRFIDDSFPDCVIRLEVEKENEAAVHVYEKAGFGFIDYDEMIKI